MPSQKGKSAHLEKMEDAFTRRTRRFSAFDILGLNEAEDVPADDTKETEISSLPVEDLPPDPNTLEDTPVDDIHRGVDDTPIDHYPVGTTHTHVCGTHTKVVVKERSNTAEKNTTTVGVDPHTHMYVESTHTPVDIIHTVEPSEEPEADLEPVQPRLFQAEEQVQDVAAAMVIRGQLTEKARQVVAYLNQARSLEQPSYTVPVGYSQVSASAGVSDHYLRREIIPKLAMLGLIGIAHRSFQGTTYHLHHDPAFYQLIAAADTELGVPMARFEPQQASLPIAIGGAGEGLPDWVDREQWGWLPPESVHQLVMKAGSAEQAQEKLEVIVYNETHGPAERRVRDRRAVLSYYLRTQQADIWPNDDGYETLAVRQAREDRDRALQEKALAEEALQARQEAAKARFLAGLEPGQEKWLKQEAKQRVDERPEARMLKSRYPLYKAEEEALVMEWMDRVAYGESVPAE